jgi:hypothetical protein
MRGLIVQWLERVPDKRKVSSSNLLKPIIQNMVNKKKIITDQN